MKIFRFYIFSILIVFTITVNGQNLNGQVFYKAKLHEKDSTKRYNQGSEHKNTINKDLDLIISAGEEFLLLLNFNDEASFFLNKTESLKINKVEQYKFNMAKIIYKVGSQFYFLKKKNELVEINNMLGETFLITGSSKIMDWKLSKETKKIGDYECYKAIRTIELISARGEKFKRNQVVWYTLDIPVPYGPTYFVGFPGLVLQVFDGDLEYVANKIVINSSDKIKIKEPTNGIKITVKDFKRIEKESFGNFIKINKN